MRPRPRLRRWRGGLRFKLMLASLVLISIPLLVVWSVGWYEELARQATESEVRAAVAELRGELALHPADAVALARAGDWLEDFARRRHLMVRVLDATGRTLERTSPADADRWSALRPWFHGVGDWFYGRAGTPELLAFEAGLPGEGERPEVRAALAGHEAGRWRDTEDGRLVLYYHALPLPGGAGGALYLTRTSQRSIRLLYGLRYPLLKLTLILGLVAAAVGLWLGWRVVRPLLELQRSIEAYLRRTGEAGASGGLPALHRQDEIGDLSRNLAELTTRLDRRLQETAQGAADLAHDLKSPLATVAVVAERLLDEASGDAAADRPDRRQRQGRALAGAAAHMRRSVEGMLALARLDESLATTPRVAVDPALLLEELVQSYRDSPQWSGIAFVTALPPTGELWLRGIPGRLAELVRNLLDNALELGARRVQIGVARGPDGGTLRLTVADDGPGVAEGNRELIFRRFFTVRPEGAAPGDGLGLAIVRAIAQAHGGTVLLLDHGPLPGACFAVDLPAAAADDPES